jgi:hypothetical protein
VSVVLHSPVLVVLTAKPCFVRMSPLGTGREIRMTDWERETHDAAELLQSPACAESDCLKLDCLVAGGLEALPSLEPSLLGWWKEIPSTKEQKVFQTLVLWVESVGSEFFALESAPQGGMAQVKAFPEPYRMPRTRISLLCVVAVVKMAG